MCSEAIVCEPRQGQPMLMSMFMPRLVLVCAVVCTFGVRRVEAQLAQPVHSVDSARPKGDVPADVERPVERYRNGAQWITVEREGSAAAGLSPVLLRAGAQAFHAHIDGHAIIQLSARMDLRAVLRREGLRLVRPLSTSVRLYLVAADSGADGAADSGADGAADSGAAGAADSGADGPADSGEDGVQLASRLVGADGVLEAAPDLYLPRVRASIHIPPNDPHYSGQWYLKKLGIDKAWHLSTGDRDTTVAVIDDGCDLQHPDLRDKFSGGLDVVDQDDDPSFDPSADNNAHGTECAGLIGAKTDNGIGMAGVCPDCGLLCIRLLPANGDLVPVSADIAAFDFAMQQGASVVSNSWGFQESVPAPAPLRSLLEELYDKGRGGRGTLVVFAAGNENREILSNEVFAVRGVLTVGAINNFDESAPFSNHGDSVGLTAPAGTFTTDISGPGGMQAGDYTNSFGGTSSACPVVAGVAGLIMSARKDMTAHEAGELLEQTARPAPYAEPDSSGHDATYGYGIVDPVAALRKTLGVSASDAADGGARSANANKASSGCGVVARAGDDGAAVATLVAMGLWLWGRRRCLGRTY